MPKKILIVGEVFSENLGDAVICQTEKKIIEQAYPNVGITFLDMSGRKNYQEYIQFKEYTFLQKLFIKKMELISKIFPKSALSQAYFMDEGRYLRVLYLLNEKCKREKFDLVIFAGGALFMDYFAGIIYLIVRKFRTSKTKIIFHACGLGELSKNSIKLLRYSFAQRNVKSISLRDSYAMFQKIFSSPKLVEETYDIALNCREYYEESEEKVAKYGIGVIGINKYYRFQKELIYQFSKSTKSWKIFTNGASYDEEIAKRILRDLGISEKDYEKYLVNSPCNDHELIETITSFECIVSFRMHSQIIAASYGIKSYGFVWNQKVKEFYKKIGFPNNCTQSIISIENLCFLDRIEYDRDELKKNVDKGANHSKSLLLKQIEKCI